KLGAEGLVDPARVGIIGFSRTCYYVMEAITTSSLRFAAASITDGIMQDYVQYLEGTEVSANQSDPEADIGPRPLGEGLKPWLQRSPLFKMDKVTAPLMVGSGRLSLWGMWSPYAALRLQNKPVDLVIFNSASEHPYYNPGVRMASQGGSVDWFRFW